MFTHNYKRDQIVYFNGDLSSDIITCIFDKFMVFYEVFTLPIKHELKTIILIY